MLKLIKLLSLTLIICCAHGAYAQTYPRSLEMLSEINRINPKQNPRFEDSARVLGRRVLDSKNKVIGDVKDIILTQNGSIEQLNVDFNRLRLNTSIYLNYGSMQIEPVSNGYAMGFDSNQIEQIYPTLLAETATAAGDSDETFSVRSVIGGQVKASDGRVLGTVEDVLFGSNASRAEALLIKLSSGSQRGKSIALPFMNPSFEDSNGRKNVVLDNEMANAVLEFAKTR